MFRQAIPGRRKRDVQFLGLAVPGAEGLPATEDLVASWRTTGGERFQNYEATFTILDIPSISRAWIDGLATAGVRGAGAPAAFLEWIDTGRHRALRAPRTLQHPDKDAQLPSTAIGTAMLDVVHAYFADDPHRFEACALKLWEMDNVGSVTDATVTRRSVDGGRDAIGFFELGPASDRVRLELVLEAKCYGPSNAVGVSEIARLISRMRHRMFGVFVTTSYVGPRAYKEVREDGHPMVILGGGDIVRILENAGYATPARVRTRLETNFP